MPGVGAVAARDSVAETLAQEHHDTSDRIISELSSPTTSGVSATSQRAAASRGTDEEKNLIAAVKAEIDATQGHLVLVTHLSTKLQWAAKHKKRRGKLNSFLKKKGFRIVQHPAKRHNVAVTYGGDAGSPADATNLIVPIVVVHTTREYKAMARKFVTSDDVVLEIGCAEALTTKIIEGLAKDVVGIDLSAKEIQRAQARFPELELHVMNGLDHAAIKKLRPKFTKVFVDVSGTRSLDQLMPVVECVERKLQPRLIVVKSVYLNQLKEKLLVGQNMAYNNPSTNTEKTAPKQPEGSATDSGADTKKVIAHLVQSVQKLESNQTTLTSLVCNTSAGGRRVSFPAVVEQSAVVEQKENPHNGGDNNDSAGVAHSRARGAPHTIPLDCTPLHLTPSVTGRSTASTYVLDHKFNCMYFPMPPMNDHKSKSQPPGMVSKLRNFMASDNDAGLLEDALQSKRTCLDLKAIIAPNDEFIAIVTPRIVELSILPDGVGSRPASPLKGVPMSTGFSRACSASVSLDRLRASLGLALLEEYGTASGPPPHVAELTKLALADGGYPTFAPLLTSWHASSSVFACAQGSFIYLILLRASNRNVVVKELKAQVRTVLLPEGSVCVGLSVLSRSTSGSVQLVVCLRSGAVSIITCTAAAFSKTFEIREFGVRGGIAEATATADVSAYSYISTADVDPIYDESNGGTNGGMVFSPTRRRRSSIGSHKVSRLHVQWRTIRLPNTGLQRIDSCSIGLAPANDEDDESSDYDDADEIIVLAAGGPVARPSTTEIRKHELSAVVVVAIHGLYNGTQGRSAFREPVADVQHVLGFASSEASVLALKRNAGTCTGILARFSRRFRAIPAGLLPLTRVSFSPCGRYLCACDLSGDVSLWRMLANGQAPAKVFQASNVLDLFWTATGASLGLLQQLEPTARQAAVRFFDLAPMSSTQNNDEVIDEQESSAPRRIKFVQDSHGDSKVALPFESAFQLVHRSGANGTSESAADQVVMLEIAPTSATATSEGEGATLGRNGSASALLGPLVAAAVRIRVARALP